VLHTQGLRLAFAAGEPFRLARSLGSDAVLVAMPGVRSRSRAMRRLAQARRIAAPLAEPALDGWLLICEGVTSLQLGAFHDAQRAFDAAEDVLERRSVGTLFEASNARECALWTLVYRGELGRLSERLPRALELATALDNKLAVLKLRCGPTHVAQLAAGEPDQLLASCEADLVGLSPETYPFPFLCTLFARVRASTYLGRAHEALELIDASRPRIRRAGLLYSQFFRIDVTSLQAWTAIAAIAERPGDADRLAAIAARGVRRLRGERAAWATALAAAIEASLATRRSAPDAAGDGLAAAADQLAACGLGLHAASLRHQAARWSGSGVAGPWAAAPLISDPDAFAQTLTPLPAR
jgi:hypothetical protein